MGSKLKNFSIIFNTNKLYKSSYQTNNAIRFYGNSIKVTLDQIKHDQKEGKFYVKINDLEASIIYTIKDGVIRILHTYVPEKLGGAGIAGLLSETAFKHVDDNKLKMNVLCSYAANYLEKRAPQYKKCLVQQ